MQTWKNREIIICWCNYTQKQILKSSENVFKNYVTSLGAPLDMPVIVCVITTSNVVKRSVHERRVNGRTVNITKLTELRRQLTSAVYRHCVKTSLPTTLMGRVKQLVRCVCVACAASWPSQPVAEVTCNLSKFLHTQTSSASCRQRVSISAVHYYYY